MKKQTQTSLFGGLGFLPKQYRGYREEFILSVWQKQKSFGGTYSPKGEDITPDEAFEERFYKEFMGFQELVKLPDGTTRAKFKIYDTSAVINVADFGRLAYAIGGPEVLKTEDKLVSKYEAEYLKFFKSVMPKGSSKQRYDKYVFFRQNVVLYTNTIFGIQIEDKKIKSKVNYAFGDDQEKTDLPNLESIIDKVVTKKSYVFTQKDAQKVSSYVKAYRSLKKQIVGRYEFIDDKYGLYLPYLQYLGQLMTTYNIDSFDVYHDNHLVKFVSGNYTFIISVMLVKEGVEIVDLDTEKAENVSTDKDKNLKLLKLKMLVLKMKYS